MQYTYTSVSVWKKKLISYLKLGSVAKSERVPPQEAIKSITIFEQKSVLNLLIKISTTQNKFLASD